MITIPGPNTGTVLWIGASLLHSSEQADPALLDE